jgi:hypothetical protein
MRSFGIPMRKWENNIKMDIEEKVIIRISQSLWTTTLRLDDLRNRGPSQEIFRFTTASRRTVSTHPVSYIRDTWGCFPGCKEREEWRWYSTPSSVEVKNDWKIPQLPLYFRGTSAQSQSGLYGEEKILAPTRSRIPACSLQLYCLSYSCCMFIVTRYSKGSLESRLRMFINLAWLW